MKDDEKQKLIDDIDAMLLLSGATDRDVAEVLSVLLANLCGYTADPQDALASFTAETSTLLSVVVSPRARTVQ